jgi:Holliday junction resolvase
MRGNRRDDNEREIIEGLKRIGCTVQPLGADKNGLPDLLVGLAGRNYLIEVKDGKKPPSATKLTPKQVEWHREWGGQVSIAKNVDEALEIVTRGFKIAG